MGLMKQYLMHKITEFADKQGIPEEKVYQDDELYRQATEYADKCLKEEYAKKHTNNYPEAMTDLLCISHEGTNLGEVTEQNRSKNHEPKG